MMGEKTSVTSVCHEEEDIIAFSPEFGCLMWWWRCDSRWSTASSPLTSSSCSRCRCSRMFSCCDACSFFLRALFDLLLERRSCLSSWRSYRTICRLGVAISPWISPDFHSETVNLSIRTLTCGNLKCLSVIIHLMPSHHHLIPRKKYM